jgi:hypothetical protein
MNRIINGVDRQCCSELTAALRTIYPKHQIVYIGEQRPSLGRDGFEPPLEGLSVTASRHQVFTPLYAFSNHTSVLNLYHFKVIDGYYDGQWVRIIIPNSNTSALSTPAYHAAPTTEHQQHPGNRLWEPNCDRVFHIRCHIDDSLTDVQIDANELHEASLNELGAHLWRGLTPTAYARLRDGFWLRYWKHPNWILSKFLPHEGAKAQAKWWRILDDIVDGDVLWLGPLLSRDGWENVSPHGPTMISTPLSNTTFLIRCERIDRVTDVQINGLELLQGSLNELCALLWEGLTPSEFDSLRNGIRLKYWRNPTWQEKEITRYDKEKAQAVWRELLDVVVEGDVLWLQPAWPREGGDTV